MAKTVLLCAFAFATLLVGCMAQNGLKLNPHITASNWPTASFNTPYPAAWITGSPASSGFSKAFYDAPTNRAYYAGPFSVGFTNGLSGSVPTIIAGWTDAPLNNLILIYRNPASSTNGNALIIHDVSYQVVSLTSPYTVLLGSTPLTGALQITDAVYQAPYLVMTYLVSGGATSGFWYNTGNGATGSMTLSSNRRCFTSFYHSGLNNLYWGCLGGFLWNSASNRPVDGGGTTAPTFVTAGAGNFTSGILSESLNRLFLGSSIGLGISIDLTTTSVTHLFFTFGSNSLSALVSVSMDTTVSPPVLFWGTDDGRVVRVNTRDFKTVFSSANLGVRELLSSTLNNNGAIVYGFGYRAGEATTNNNYHTWSLVKNNCSSYSCSQCLGVQNVDKEYCGMCVDTGICSTQTDCAGTSWTQSGTCPSADSVSLATMGSTSGGTVSQFNGAYFKTGSGEIANYKCSYFVTPGTYINGTVEAIDTGFIQCRSPAWASATTVNVLVSYKNRIWAGNWQFTYYDCAATTSCSQCGSTQPDCGWCFRTNQCASQAQCGATAPAWQAGRCPSVGNIAVTNTSKSHSSPLTLTVPVTNFIEPSNGESFTCIISGVGTVPATVVGSGASMTAVTCQIDPSVATVDSDGQSFYQISVGRTTPSVTYGTTPLANLEIYDCTGLPTCFDCRDIKHSRCTWCSNVPSCAYTSALPGGCTTVSQCTTISSLSKTKGPVLATKGTLFTITGSNIAAAPAGPDVCFWKVGSSAVVGTLLSRTSASSVSCNAPDPMSAGTYAVSLGISSTQRTVTNSLALEIYDCRERLTCGSCISTDVTDACMWCPSVANLGCVENSASCPSGPISGHTTTACPTLVSAAPDVFSVDGGPNTTLTGLHKVSSGEAASTSCGFFLPGQPQQLSTLTWINSSAVLCSPVPSFAASGTAEVAIVSSTGSVNITNSVPIVVATCERFSTCGECIGSPFSFCTWCGATCNSTCPPQLTHEACPTFSYISPNSSILTGGDKVSIYGSNFLVSAKRSSLYKCVWDASTRTDVTVESPEVMSCLTPARSLQTLLPLTVEFSGKPYLSTSGVEFFSCISPPSTHCTDQCAQRPNCGWCLGTQSCGSEYQCSQASSTWMSGTCAFATLDATVVPVEGDYPVTAMLSQTMPEGTPSSEVTCSFGTFSVSAEVIQSGNFSEGAGTTEVRCVAPKVAAPVQVLFGIQYRSNEYIAPMAFNYADCSLNKGCTECIAATNCGWCSQGNRCTFLSQCVGNDAKWAKSKCPLNKVALGVGLGIGLFALLCLLILAFFLIRRARKARGLVINLKEPNYDEIAWGTDVTLAWKVPEHEYKILETGLSRKDFLLQLAIAFNCPATEQDAMAKALVYVASVHGIAAEMIQTCIRFEVQTCKQENTLFRNNSVASKMYKFFSRIVGIKYLFNCIARVILELEILGRQQDIKSGSSSGSNEVSLLSMSMELDQTKALGDDIDTDTNLLQLQLICQKLLNVLIKTSLKNIPAPFRKIFVEIDNSVMGKFAGSNDAVYKGIGGLFFLRFVCPAITAPHVYGLLEKPPNTITQRQLVLISKVIQNIANMQPPGKKEEYMTALNDFIVQSIPKIIKFYDNLRMAVNVPQPGETDEQVTDVPNEVRLNGLASIWNFLYTEKDKIKVWIDSPDCPFEEQERGTLKELLAECEAEYGSAPKKLKHGATAELEHGKKKKK